MLSLSRFQTLRSLRHRNFRLMVIGALLSNAGDFMQNVAQSWLVWHLTRSAFLLGVVGFFDSIPRLLLGALGGAITDRFDRRRLLILTQVLGMIQAFIYWLAVYFDFILYWHILVLACILGVVNTLNQTARQSLVNSLVPREDLSNAIALHASVFNLSRVLGPSVGGLVIATLGIAGCFFLNALSFLALILTLILMELPAWDGSSRRAGLWNEIEEGYRYLRSNSQMFAIVMLSYVVATSRSALRYFCPGIRDEYFASGAFRLRSSHVRSRYRCHRGRSVACFFELTYSPIRFGFARWYWDTGSFSDSSRSQTFSFCHWFFWSLSASASSRFARLSTPPFNHRRLLTYWDVC